MTILLHLHCTRVYSQHQITQGYILNMDVKTRRILKDLFMFRWNCAFRTQVIHDITVYSGIEIKCVPFQNKLSFAVATCCLIFFVRYTIFSDNTM